MPDYLPALGPPWHRAEHLRDPASPLPARPQVRPGQEPQVTTCPPTRSCPEGEPPVKYHFPAHGDDGSWRCPRRAPTEGQAFCGQL